MRTRCKTPSFTSAISFTIPYCLTALYFLQSIYLQSIYYSLQVAIPLNYLTEMFMQIVAISSNYEEIKECCFIINLHNDINVNVSDQRWKRTLVHRTVYFYLINVVWLQTGDRSLNPSINISVYNNFFE